MNSLIQSYHRFIMLCMAICLVGASTFAQKNIEHIMRPTFDSSEVVLAHIDSLVTDSSHLPLLEPMIPYHSTPITYNIDPNKIVGEIPYQLTTTPSGQVEIIIPIDDFASEHESSPQISLHYTSQGGISCLGSGWYIGGISKIELTNKNYFTDGNIDGRNIVSPIYRLDGVRLLQQMLGDPDEYYLTQTGQTLVVRPCESDTFYAHLPDGTICEYASPINHLVSWPIIKKTDKYGKEIVYSYMDNSSADLIQNVTYGEGRSLLFVYENAQSSRKQFVDGTELLLQKKLVRIDVLSNEQLLRRYEVEYMDTSISAPITKISITAADGQSVNPLCFYYQAMEQVHGAEKSPEKQLTAYFNFSEPDKLIATRGKLDYATEEDAVILYPNKFTYKNNIFHEGDYNADDEFLVYYGLNGISSSWVSTLGPGFVDILCMDTDSLHGEELVKINQTIAVCDNQFMDALTIDVYAFDIELGMHLRKQLSFNEEHNLNFMRWPKYFLSGDFDGDGMQELLECRINDENNSDRKARVRLLDLNNGTVKFSQELDRFTVKLPSTSDTESQLRDKANTSDRLFATDLNGDGKLEMCILTPSGISIYSFCFNDNNEIVMTKKLSQTLLLGGAYGYVVSVGDANGDGNSDLFLLPNEENKNVVIHYSKGDGQLFGRETLNITSNNETQYLCFDFDQDGQTDILEHYKSSLAGIPSHPHVPGINRNKMWVHSLRDGNVVTNDYIMTRGRTVLVPATIFGESSNSSIISINNDAKYEIYRCSDPKNMSSLLTAVADSRGRISQMEYQQLYQGAYYQPGFNMIFPYSVYAGGMFVCSAMTTGSGSLQERDLTFSYHNATIHMQGFGFCGFQNISTTDNIRNETTYQTFDPTHFGVPVSVVSEQETRGYGYQTTVANDKRIQILLKNDTITNHATGVTAINAYTHDTYGNVLTATTSLPGNITKIITNEYTNIITEGNWLIGLERRHTESVTRGDSTLIEGRTTTYNGSWLPDTVVTWRGSEQNPVLTQMIRYNNNRPDRVKTRAYMGTTLIRHIGYSADSRLPQFVSDERGMRTTYAYGCFGVTQSSLTPETGMWVDDDELPDTPIVGPLGPLGGGTEINGGGQNILDPPPFILPEYPTLDTYYHYDSFGRQDSIIAPDGSVKAVSLAWASDVPGALYMSEQSETNKPSIRTWFDALGRKVREGTQRANGTWTYTLYEYNTLGLLARESLPTTTGNASSWTTYSYEDTFDRLEEKEYPDGHSDTYAYSGLTTTSVIDGVTTSRTVDALGDLVSVTDGGGTLLYDLRPDGQPREIRAPGNIATTFTYDQYGRRISISDPSAGTRTTTYDANGHVASETDARGKTITSTYTADGRLTSRTFSNTLSVNYSYNSWNMPTRMTGSDGHSKSWTYNDLQQLTSESTDGFRKAYTYDQNMLASVAYSKDNGYICSENYTRMNGHLTSVTLNTGDTIWALDKQNPRMLPTKVRLGKLSQSLSYDVYGRVTGREVTDREHEDLQYLQYYYNMSTGNMTLRWDHVNGTDETFSYDALNRLTGILPCNSSSCMLSQSTSYDGKGNITSHHTSGQYTYGFNNGNGTSQPYAFSELSSPSSLIPQREQHISYNAMQQPDTIREGSYLATFCYYGDMTRASMTVTDTVTHNVETRTYYDQQYNEFTKTTGNTTLSKRILWLGGSPYNAPAALVKRYGEQNWTLVHVLRDNLGSITHVVDTTGVVLQEMGYSAWGLLRDVESLEPYAPDSQPELLLGRGYTGHEHLSWFGLINMNARLYDPAVGRFLSPDPLVQAPDNTQNYNRYSYCLNNPLRFVDQDGKVFILVPFLVGAVVGATISGLTYAVTSAATKQWSWKHFGLSVAMGAVAGVISAGVGMAGAALASTFQGASKFGMTLAVNLLGQSANYAASNAISGQSFNYYDIIAIAGSALLASTLPAFKPALGSGIKNALADIGYSTWRGGMTGLMQGGIRFAFDGRADHMNEGMMGGMATGISSSLFMNTVFGAPISPNNRPGEVGTYRQGGIASYIMKSGAITLGLNMNLGNRISESTVRHEYAHVLQQMYMGWANFYTQILYEYNKYGFIKSYSTPWTLENFAKNYGDGWTDF